MDLEVFLLLIWHCHIDFVHRRVEKRRAAVQVNDFQGIRPFGLRGKWPPDHQYVSSAPSKIPYSGFSPVRLQTEFQPRPLSNIPSLSARPALTSTSLVIYQLNTIFQH